MSIDRLDSEENSTGSILLSIPIGLLYACFFQKMTDVVFVNDDLDKQFQNSMIILFFIGFVSIISGLMLRNGKMRKHRSVVYGVIMGGIMLALLAMLTNWEQLTDLTKLIMLGIGLVMTLLYALKK